MTLRRAVIFLGCAMAAVQAAEPTIEFTGVLTADGKTRIALTDKTTDVTQWVEPNDAFKGYTVKRYDPAQEAVFVRKNGDGEDIRLSLSGPTARGALRAVATPTGPTASVAATTGIRSNLRAFTSAARQLQNQTGAPQVSYADVVGPGKIISELKPVAGENYSTLSFAPNVTALSVTTTDGAIVTLDIPTSAPPTVQPATAIAAAAWGTPPAATPIANEALAPTGRESAPSSYVIQGGDTWQKISETTGVPVQQLQNLNPAVKGSSLPSGQTIRIR